MTRGELMLMVSGHTTVGERRAFGKSQRRHAPRRSHAEWQPSDDRRNPVELLEEQNAQRLEFLIPERRRRMMASPFAFYRAAARVMAADLATTPVSGLQVQVCGDAHLSNFGLYASPERRLVFDLNDFDETTTGPWEWDLKRLAVSVVIAARHNQLSQRETQLAARQVIRSYRRAMKEFAGTRNTDIWYAHIDEEVYVGASRQRKTRRRAMKTVARAKTKDSHHALDRLAEDAGEGYRIRSEPPLLIPIRDVDPQQQTVYQQSVRRAWESYAESVSPACRVLLQKYRPVDVALKVVGVGSVGMRCWILLLEGRDRHDPLFLQMKQAERSVVADYLPGTQWVSQGQRIVEGQRLMQTISDIFLGWTRSSSSHHDYYWRQLRDWKGSADVENLTADALQSYSRLCAWTLARAHARSGDPVAIAGYLGTGGGFVDALTKFAARYADQNERDYEAFCREVQNGRLEAAS